MVEAEIEDAIGWGTKVERLDREERRAAAARISTPATSSAPISSRTICYIEEPKSLLVALMQAGRRVGMATVGHTAVTGIDIKMTGEFEVFIPPGDMSRPRVVDAAGAWARIVGKMAGADVKIVPMRHQLGITAPLHDLCPTCPSCALPTGPLHPPGARGPLVRHLRARPVPLGPERGQTFTLDMVPVNRGVLNEARVRILQTVPALRNATDQEQRAGLFTMTADGKFLAGPMPGVHGFWVVVDSMAVAFRCRPDSAPRSQMDRRRRPPNRSLALDQPVSSTRKSATPTCSPSPSGNTRTTTRPSARATCIEVDARTAPASIIRCLIASCRRVRSPTKGC